MAGGRANVTDAAVSLPRDLHGRRLELDRLLGDLANPVVRAVVAVGPAGVGKTALLDAALAALGQAGALTGVGKHTEGEGGEDLSPFMQALEQAVAAGLDQLYDPDAGMEGLKVLLGAKAAVFRGFGSGLLRSLASGPLSQTASAAAADERVVQACIATLRWLHGFDQPIVLQIDDWGRASERTARLYRRLIEDPDLERFRLLTSERPEEPSQISIHAACESLVVGPIDAEAGRAIVIDMLGGAIDDPARLLDFLGAATERPFDLIHSIQGLAASGGLVRRGDAWVFDPAALGFSFAERVPEGTAIRLIAGEPVQLALAQTLALFGDTADVDDVAAASGQPMREVSAALAALETAGLARRGEGRLSLTHDRLRIAVLETLDADTRRALAARLAETLLKRGAAPGADPRGAIMLLRRLDAGLDGVAPQPWAALFQAGALAARQVGDRNAADAFAEAGLSLAERVGEPSHAMLKEGVFAAVERSDHALAIARADRMPTMAANPEALAEADELRVFARRMIGDTDGAIEIARQALARGGTRLPARPTLLHVARAVLHVVAASPDWARRQPPLSTDELAGEAPLVRAINAIGSLIFERDVWMAVLLITSITPRLAAGTAAGAGAYAFMCALTGSYRKAAAWANISDSLQGPDQPSRAVGMQYSSSFGHWFVNSHADQIDRGDRLEALAYAEGDLAVAAYGNQYRVLDYLLGPKPLNATIETADQGLVIARRLKDDATLVPIAAARQMAENLTRGAPGAARLEGAFFEASALAAIETAALDNTRRLIGMLQATLACAYGDYAGLAALHRRLSRKFAVSPFQTWTQTWTFLSGLALYRTGGRPSPSAMFILRRVVRLNPLDNAHRALLLDAEAARLSGRAQKAMTLYGAAVEAGRGSASWIEYAIVAEAAAEGAALLGRQEAERFAACAHEAWRRLGADGVIAVRRAAPPPAPDQIADIQVLRAEVKRLEQRQEDRERELETARDAAERANRAKSRFLATVGHELRTPLQGLVGLVDLARETGADLNVATMGAVVGHFKAVVNDLTDLGALEGGVFPLALRPFDPTELCRAVLMLHEPSLRDGDRRIRLEAPAGGVSIVGDPVRVRQILSNLVGNAVKHAEGEIVVRLDLRVTDAMARLTIDVSDQGPGLDETALARLFEPFERGEAAETTEGLGLGLPLARALARRMDGDILVTPTPDGGTRFRLLFEAPLSERAEPQATAPLSGARVLLAEDAPLSRQVIAALLRAQGCTVAEAADGQAAIDMWRTERFDLMLLDLRMPVLDGLAVTRIVRKEEEAERRTPIVIATAAPSLELDQAAAALGVAAVLQKPVGWRDLAQALGRLHEPAPMTMPNRLDELRVALGGEADLLAAEADHAAIEAATRIQTAAAVGDHGTVVREAHRLAGLASNFGLSELADAALAVEAEARAGSIFAETLAAMKHAAG